MILKYILNYFIVSEELSGFMHGVALELDPSDQMLLEGLVEAGRPEIEEICHQAKLEEKICRSHQQLVYISFIIINWLLSTSDHLSQVSLQIDHRWYRCVLLMNIFGGNNRGLAL
jgi:hypothetical protein